MKKSAIKNVHDFLDQLNTEKISGYNKLGFIGGELFDQQQLNGIQEDWYELFKKISKTPVIDEIWLATSLLGTNHDEIQKTVSLIDNKKIYICTSWDVRGRFSKKYPEEMWLENVNKIKELKAKLSITTVLTQALIESFYFGTFSIHSIPKCDVFSFYRPEVILDSTGKKFNPPKFYLESRKMTKQFFKDFIEECGPAPIERFIDLKTHADDLITENKEMLSRFDKRQFCGHEIMTVTYDDEEHCVFCDAQEALCG
jgi:hypothetical protein